VVSWSFANLGIRGAYLLDFFHLGILGRVFLEAI